MASLAQAVAAAPTIVASATSPATPLVSASGAQVGFAVNPNRVATTVHYAYGTANNNLAASTATQAIGAGRLPVNVVGFIDGLPGNGLMPNTQYFYQLVAVGGGNTVTSPVESFTTLAFNTSVVVEHGDTAPETGGALYQSFGVPSINDADGVAFTASLTTDKALGVGATNDLGIWADDSGGALQLIARTGSAAPDVAGATYANVGDVVYNNNSQVGFGAVLSVLRGVVTRDTTTGIWSTSSGALHLVAREGDTLPAVTLTGATTHPIINGFQALAMSDANTIIIGTLTPSATSGVTAASRNCILEGTEESNLAPVLETNDTVTYTRSATTGTKTLSGFFIGATLPLVGGQPRNFATNTGDLAVLAGFTDGTTGILQGVTSTHTLSLTALSGDPVITSTGTATFSRFGNPIINTQDHVAFLATLTPKVGGITDTNDSVILAEDSSGTLQLVAQTDDPNFGYVTLSNPVYNDNDAVAFSATYKVDRKTMTGLFCNSTGSVERVVQTGDQAPGCPAGVTFRAFTAFALPDDGGATNQGGITFFGEVGGTGITAANNTGIWSVDATGTLRSIARTGQELLPGKKAVTLGFLAFSDLVGAQPVTFNKNGDLTYIATFSDNTDAIFTVTSP